MNEKTVNEYTVFVIRKWFIRKLYSAAQKVKEVQYWIFDTLEVILVFMYLKFDLSVYKISCM